ncbi:MAG: potassium transporter Kup [Bacteroidales bacterium 45-6]|nr:MAG: potassium transporter Kup [Bacteroidales bacterium 45-6]
MEQSNQHKIPFSTLGVMAAIGIVFGDIGTSPLYVMRAILNSLPHYHYSNPDYILGAVSCVIWTLTLQTTVKYVLITLKADNKGEGGILSLFALIRKKYRWAYVIAAIGAATLLADGVITPAITVFSAVEGLHDVMPSVHVIPVTALIIFVLFLVQPFGTSSLGKYFGPIMVVWFVMMGLMGTGQVVLHPEVFKAFNPVYAIRFLIEAPNTLFILGAIFLCTTGAEALYSDLGHTGLQNIRAAWVFVKIMLIVNYLGQAGWILHHPHQITATSNPFFEIMPEWFTFIGIILAALAAIVASQALITGSFTVISEAIHLNIWPSVKIKYPTKIKGQMFIPSVNYLLMASCLIIVFMFGSSMKLEAAYGLAITLSMMMTTFLLFLYMQKNGRPLWMSIPLTIFFTLIEVSFLTANLQKFMHGGFASLLIAGAIFVVMFSWYNGRRIKNHHTRFTAIDNILQHIQRVSQDTSIPKLATHLFYMTRAKKVNQIESQISYSLFNKRPKRADTYWFVNVTTVDDPYEFSYSVKTFIPNKAFRIDIRSGFKVGVHLDKYVQLICNEMEKKGQVDLSTRYPSLMGTGIKGDYLFVIVDRIFRNLEMNLGRQIVLAVYNQIKKVSSTDAEMYDIDPSYATVETVPLVIASHSQTELSDLLHQSEKVHHSDK